MKKTYTALEAKAIQDESDFLADYINRIQPKRGTPEFKEAKQFLENYKSGFIANPDGYK